jgi:LytS/YehU family sensor histidine kinase
MSIQTLLKSCVIVMISLVLSFPVKAQSKAFLDSLTQALQQSKSSCDKAKTYNELVRAYVSVDLKKAGDFASQGIQYAKSQHCQKELGNLYNSMGIVCITEGNNNQAFAFIDSSLEIHRKLNDNIGIAAALGNKGTFKIYVGDYTDALQLQLECLRIYEELKDTSAIATTLTNVFGVHYARKDYPHALETGYQAFSMFQKLKEKDGEALMCFNLASVYLDMKNLDSCLHYINQSDVLFRQIENKEGIADCYRMRSDVKREQHEYAESVALINRAILTYDSIGSVFKQVQSFSYLASVYYDMKLYEKSIAAAEQFLNLSHKYQYKQFERDAAKIMMNNYRALGKYEKAFQYNDLFMKLKDEVMNEQSISEINRLKSDYEFEMKEKEVTSVNQQKQILEYELNRKNGLIVGILLLVLLISTISFFLYQQKKLKSESKTVQLEQRLLRSQMNPHFIFNSLTAIQSFVYKSEPKEAGKFLSSFATLIRTILDNSREEQLSLSKELHWMENYLKLQLLRFENRFSYTIETDENIDLDHTLIPPMLIQPFIENALEHGFRDIDYPGEIHISFKSDGTTLLVSVSDNGLGYSNTLSNHPPDHVSHATNITQERLHLLNSNRNQPIKFSIIDLPERGTRVEFSIPLIHVR